MLSKICENNIFTIVGKAYEAADQAGGSLHTMAVLQAYQTDLLKELDAGEGLSPNVQGHILFSMCMAALVAVYGSLSLAGSTRLALRPPILHPAAGGRNRKPVW